MARSFKTSFCSTQHENFGEIMNYEHIVETVQGVSEILLGFRKGATVLENRSVRIND